MATKKTTTAKDTKKAANAVKEETKKVEKEVKTAAKKAATETKPVAKKAATETKPAAKKAAKETKTAAKSAKKTTKKASAPAVKGLFFEYAGKQVDASTLAQTAKDAFKANGGKDAVRSIELYVKAEDNALYYVINGKETGKVEL